MDWYNDEANDYFNLSRYDLNNQYNYANSYVIILLFIHTRVDLLIQSYIIITVCVATVDIIWCFFFFFLFTSISYYLLKTLRLINDNNNAARGTFGV